MLSEPTPSVNIFNVGAIARRIGALKLHEGPPKKTVDTCINSVKPHERARVAKEQTHDAVKATTKNVPTKDLTSLKPHERARIIKQAQEQQVAKTPTATASNETTTSKPLPQSTASSERQNANEGCDSTTKEPSYNAVPPPPLLMHGVRMVQPKDERACTEEVTTSQPSLIEATANKIAETSTQPEVVDPKGLEFSKRWDTITEGAKQSAPPRFSKGNVKYRHNEIIGQKIPGNVLEHALKYYLKLGYEPSSKDSMLPEIRFRDARTKLGLGHPSVIPPKKTTTKDDEDLSEDTCEFTVAERAEMASEYPQKTWQRRLLTRYGKLALFSPQYAGSSMNDRAETLHKYTAAVLEKVATQNIIMPVTTTSWQSHNKTRALLYKIIDIVANEGFVENVGCSVKKFDKQFARIDHCRFLVGAVDKIQATQCEAMVESEGMMDIVVEEYKAAVQTFEKNWWFNNL